MQVGTTLPQVVYTGTGALGQGANGRAWPYNWTAISSTCLPAPPGHAQSKCPGGCHVLSRRRTVLPARTT